MFLLFVSINDFTHTLNSLSARIFDQVTIAINFLFLNSIEMISSILCRIYGVFQACCRKKRQKQWIALFDSIVSCEMHAITSSFFLFLTIVDINFSRKYETRLNVRIITCFILKIFRNCMREARWINTPFIYESENFRIVIICLLDEYENI